MNHRTEPQKAETWELAVLFVLLIIGPATIALFWRMGHIDSLMAVSSSSSYTTSDSQVAIPPAEPESQFAPADATHQVATSTADPTARQSVEPVNQIKQTKTEQSRLERLRLEQQQRQIARHKAALLAAHAAQLRLMREQRNIRWFHGRRYVYKKTLLLRVTGYAPDRRCCWPFAGTTTASGASVHTNDGHLVAADTRLIPFGSLVTVPGYDRDRPVPVLDRGGAIHGYRLDVLLPSFYSAKDWGRKLLRVRVYQPLR